MGLFLEKEDLTLKNPMIFLVKGSVGEQKLGPLRWA